MKRICEKGGSPPLPLIGKAFFFYGFMTVDSGLGDRVPGRENDSRESGTDRGEGRDLIVETESGTSHF